MLAEIASWILLRPEQILHDLLTYMGERAMANIVDQCGEADSFYGYSLGLFGFPVQGQGQLGGNVGSPDASVRNESARAPG